MRYWKFLRAGAFSPFTGYRWSPGVWVHSEHTRPCVDGFHACRAGDLPYWLGEQLWLVELDGEITELDHKVMARRAMLVKRVSGWDPDTSREFALGCVRRVAGYAADELAAHGLGGQADSLREASEPGGWGSAAEAGADAAERIDARQAVRLCGYVQDAIDTFESYPVSSNAYLAARVADECLPASDTDTDTDGYEIERAWQARWLVDRLGLEAQPG